MLFIDRDGTLIREPPGGYIDSLDKLVILPHVIESLQRLMSAGFDLVMISNQPGRGTDKFPEENFIVPQNKLMQIFAENNIDFFGTYFCPHFREDKCTCMKPKTGLIDHLLKNRDIDLASSCVIGDRSSDIELARNIDCKAIYYSEDTNEEAVLCSNNWLDITNFILG